MKTIAMIPARMGSTRLKLKNLALINGRPMIEHVVEAAKKSGTFERVVINSDGDVFREIAERCGVEFYHRPEELGGNTIKSDDVVLNFMETHPCDAVAWVNSIAPLQPAEEMSEVVKYFEQENLDSLQTVHKEQVHCLMGGKPLNFSVEGKFAQTQDLSPIERFVYSIMMWRCDTFKAAMAQKGNAFFAGKVGYFPVGHLSSLIVKTEQDLVLCDQISRALALRSAKLEYDPLIEKTGLID